MGCENVKLFFREPLVQSIAHNSRGGPGCPPQTDAHHSRGGSPGAESPGVGARPAVNAIYRNTILQEKLNFLGGKLNSFVFSFQLRRTPVQVHRRGAEITEVEICIVLCVLSDSAVKF